MLTTAVIALVLLWAAFNFATPYAAAHLAQRISPGRLPAELLRRGEARRVRFYVGRCAQSYAFSAWAPPYTVVIFDTQFFSRATPEMLRYVVAHELGHAARHHHVWRWLAAVTLTAYLPAVRRALLRQEVTADDYAEGLTGFRREHFERKGPEAARGGTATQ